MKNATITLSTIEAFKTEIGTQMVCRPGTSPIAREKQTIPNRLENIKAAIEDFAERVHQNHPSLSFMVRVSWPDKERSARGFNEAHRNNELGAERYVAPEQK